MAKDRLTGHIRRAADPRGDVAPRCRVESVARFAPMLRAGLTSGTIMAGGDLLCQTIQMQYQPAVAGTAENEKVEKPKKCEERSAPASTSGAHWMSAAVREAWTC